MHKGCTKAAKGTTYHCVTHGGGRRCMHDSCRAAARQGQQRCSRHTECAGENCSKMPQAAPHTACPSCACLSLGCLLANAGGSHVHCLADLWRCRCATCLAKEGKK